jgi:tritrans,polycis-undecaprenyl-diphosphate synthase [geranylgeranyl-diphosphate specific]
MEINSPKNIAIILDGNRRFAKKLMLEPWKGHEYGREKVEELIEYATSLGIKEITLYALSVENINSRPKKELNFLYDLFRETFKEMNKEKIKKNKIKFRFIGNLSLLPKDLNELCKNLEKDTKNNKGLQVNIALAYGGRQEITEAIKNIVKKIKDNTLSVDKINEDLIKDYLYISSEPDLIIRTGGEKRTSNFLAWQSAYSELIFLDKMWPEFNKQDLIECCEEYKSRKRNFGK